ncbi:hypothetical protein GE061_007486 [Apolygus lucorum]|uniref:Uncharacterized protein n=1 Tax=Apolygus lucorum TaxID=248454 RepID=A0A8S9WRA5_APOLU|nr:hypothetical protein GE061_007486 [Apolygus lucorum]
MRFTAKPRTYAEGASKPQFPGNKSRILKSSKSTQAVDSRHQREIRGRKTIEKWIAIRNRRGVDISDKFPDFQIEEQPSRSNKHGRPPECDASAPDSPEWSPRKKARVLQHI